MAIRNPGSVMVVDDDPLLLDSVMLLLTGHGFDVTGFTDGQAALAAFREAPTDVVLTDINMPAFNGFRLLEKIRDFDRETPVIFITGNADLDVALTAISLQAFEFILKPFSTPRLVSTIELPGRTRTDRDPTYQRACRSVEGSTADEPGDHRTTDHRSRTAR
jgi:cyclic di-GMP phosphodiesterase